ncbi:hypothetical protein ABMD26_002180 [Pseudomonas sp. PvP001]
MLRQCVTDYFAALVRDLGRIKNRFNLTKKRSSFRPNHEQKNYEALTTLITTFVDRIQKQF